ncbi:DUF445 domain-containing protein [Alterisphingorhabdus coralli]|uniref:DUF445 domain-containing protein n=1 Tax=Alterisphingorhabdus coralli TaxID=3071408 RepID=A0AA97F944_9SPHN|nr:DUF445 domain-containing protein [Parasphingorhabdus sp. SCSIO 66989]WOE76674.1 DUF445 domain-containing protein [Parasphingorhabdus sp. SCSIO 66989]
MRIVATSLLLLMALVFIGALQLEAQHPAWGYVVAFSEAALVGGLADWFAVTALFRHPLGLPIPHTAIIPNNKDRIATTMAGFLRSNFLIPKVMARRMRNMNVAAAAGRFLIREHEGDAVGESAMRLGLSSLFADVMESLDNDKLGGIVKSALRQQLTTLQIAPLLGQILKASIADGRHRPLIDSFILWGARTLEANEHLIRDMVHEKANTIMRWTGLDDRLANGVVDGLYKLLTEVADDPEHPLREKVEEGLATLADDLINDPKMHQRVADIKAEVISNPAMGRWIDGLWERGRTALLTAARDPDRSLSGQFSQSLEQVGDALMQEGELQIQVNRFARRTLVGVATRYGDQIVRLISETVRGWDTRTLTARVEGAVGRDLQFIRINGTLVGGLVGLTIHGILQLAKSF